MCYHAGALCIIRLNTIEFAIVCCCVYSCILYCCMQCCIALCAYHCVTLLHTSAVCLCVYSLYTLPPTPHPLPYPVPLCVCCAVCCVSVCVLCIASLCCCAMRGWLSLSGCAGALACCNLFVTFFLNKKINQIRLAAAVTEPMNMLVVGGYAIAPHPLPPRDTRHTW